MSNRCVHGMDGRFCAICQRAAAGGAQSLGVGSTPGVAEVLRFLNETRTRATYSAVAGVLSIPARSVGSVLGERRPEASWVVSSDTQLPTGYEPADWHPELLMSPAVIQTARELSLRMALWRATQTK